MRQVKISVTLVTPDLFPAVADSNLAEISCPALQKLLARANVTQSAPINLESQLCKLFNIPLQPDTPTAAITALVDGLPSQQGFWLRADPVQLYADRAAVYLFGNSHLQLEPHEINSLLADIQTLLPAGMQLYAPEPTRWYLHTNTDVEIATHPLAEVIGKNISAYLPSGKDAFMWQQLLTEIQMLVHQHPVNQQRQQQGKAPVNGLWLSGAGRLPQVGDLTWQKIYSDGVLGQGFAKLLGQESVPMQQGIDAQEPIAESLLIVEKARDFCSHQEWQLWRDLVNDLEEKWFAPLLAKMLKREVDRIVLYSDKHCYQLDRKNLRRWWRRVRPLANYI